MDLLAFILGWFHGWVAAGGGRVDVRYGASDHERAKRSAWVEVDGLRRSGQLTIWESGEVEAEVNDISSVELVFSRSAVVQAPDELRDLLVELLQEVEREDR